MCEGELEFDRNIAQAFMRISRWVNTQKLVNDHLLEWLPPDYNTIQKLTRLDDVTVPRRFSAPRLTGQQSQDCLGNWGCRGNRDGHHRARLRGRCRLGRVFARPARPALRRGRGRCGGRAPAFARGGFAVLADALFNLDICRCCGGCLYRLCIHNFKSFVWKPL
jgi:hypothetical protein